MSKQKFSIYYKKPKSNIMANNKITYPIICAICKKERTGSMTGVCKDCRYKIDYAKELGIKVRKINVKHM